MRQEAKDCEKKRNNFVVKELDGDRGKKVVGPGIDGQVEGKGDYDYDKKRSKPVILNS
jgi:hypothetical protein